MGELVDIAFSFPAIVFTISTIVLVGFWAATMLIGGGLDALDGLDLGLDAEVELDIDVDADVELAGSMDTGASSVDSAGVVQTVLQFLGIVGMPLLLALNLLSLFAWAITMITVVVIGPSTGSSTISPLMGLLVAVGAFVFSGFITGRVASRYGAAMAPTKALRRGELVGRFCTITTQRVTTDFGQAEVRDAEGGSLIVQVRATEDNQLGRGDKALIVNVDNDAGIYQIAVGLEELAD